MRQDGPVAVRLSIFAGVFIFPVCLLTLMLAEASAQTNPIVIENQQPGATGWDVDGDRVGTDAIGQIKGYASAVSVNKGQNITFHISVNPAQTYTLDIFRIGWYQGLGGRLMQHIGPLNGVRQATCPTDPTMGTIECHWTPSYTLSVPTSWTSGIYIGALTNAQGFKNYMIFVVRDDSRVAPLIYQQPVTTYQASNTYPNDGVTGKSLSDWNSFGPIVPATGERSAAKVSFDRPYYDSGIGEDFNGITAEINFVRWLERSGYDVTYSTDVDTHANGSRLLNYRGILSVGHDEYWSKQMFDAVVAARDAGVNVGFFGSNSIYWQIRMEPSSTGVPNRLVVCYKDEFRDPITTPTLKTTLWRGSPVNRPEQTLIGVQYTPSSPPQDNQGFFPSFVVTNSSHWVYAGTGFTNGSSVRGLVAPETDRFYPNDTPPNAVPGTHVILSHSPWGGGPDDYSESSIYQAPSGAWVYATGAMLFNYGLDDYGHGEGHVDVRIQKTAANVLDRFISGSSQPSPSVSSVTPASGPAAGGTAITIQGANFVAGATVTVGGTAAGAVTFVDSTRLTAATPVHAAGTVDVVVANPDGRSGTLANAFTYNSTAPAVNVVSPSVGPTGGGTVVTLTGINYAAGATVTIGGAAATGVTVVNGTTITATTPAHAAGSVNVTVTNTDGQSGTMTAGFTYVLPAPTVTGVTPGSGPTIGGTAITITGTNFRAGATVSLGGSVATGVTVVNSTTITAITALHVLGAVGVTVTNTDAQSATLASGYTYTVSTAAPAISNVTPGSGLTTGGSAVTITGANFAPGATVTIGGTAATGVTVVNSATITATTPAHAAGQVSVTVMNVDLQSATLVSAFTYVTPTAITFVQVGEATPQTPTAVINVAFPSAQTPGDLNVVAVGSNDTTSSVQSVQDNRGNTYLLAIGPTIGTGLRQSIYYAKNIVGGATTVTVTFNQPAIYPDVRILEYRGVNALDVTAGASGTGTASSSGPATTTGPNELIVGAMMVSSYTAAVGPGFTGRVYTKIDSDLAEDMVAVNAGTYSATATAGSGNWVMQMAAFKLLTAPAPAVTGVSPASGPASGATAVTITGSNFTTGATVTIGGSPATGVTVVNDTTITATTPVHAAGPVGVTVTNPDGQTGTRANAFTYLAAAPTVTGLAPASGAATGGTTVTISGTGFAAGATVTVGGAAAPGVTVVNSTTITATTPAHATGPVSVTVTNLDGQAGTRTDAFTYLGPAPTVTGVAPSSGPTSGGTTVTITGTSFGAGATVTVGGAAATAVTVVGSTSITATTPPHAVGPANVVVTNTDGQSSALAGAFTYIGPAPTLTSVAPGSGSTGGGTAITLTGTNFAAGATVTVGGAAATGVTVVNANTITATAPPHAAGVVDVAVTNADTQSATLASAFSYIAPAPTVTGVAPASGATTGGTAVTISGTGFVAGATVTVGGAPAPGAVVVNSTTITATTPAHAAGLVSVTVTNPDGQAGSRTDAFTYLGPAPTVTAVAPSSGPTTGGTTVTIVGTNFGPGATVTVGGVAATTVTVVDSTSITAATPAHVAGQVSVTVTNTDGQSGALATAFTYLGPAPTLTNVAPSTGSTSGGTAITLGGANFAAGATVTIGGAAATGVTVVNSATITATAPAHAAGAVSVTVINPDGQGATLADAFTFSASAPSITSITPTSGSPGGGTTVTISGSNFGAGATVMMGGTAATNVVVVSSTTITARTPAHAGGAVSVTVSNPDGQTGVLTNGFTFNTSTITVTAPNTAVSWRVGDKKNITFSHTLGVGQVVNILVSRDSGATWSPITTFTTTSATSGTYSWQVSGPVTKQARIRVTWAVDSIVSDMSDVNFTVNSRTTVTAPNTSVTWAAGSTRQVTWSHNLGVGGLVDIAFSPDNGVTWAPLAEAVASSAATSGTYVGAMPTTVTTQGLIRVSPAGDPTLGDVSDVTFTLAAPTVTVTAPNTNVSWAIGSTQNIKWNHNLGTRDAVTIELARDGVNYSETIAASVLNSGNTSSTFSWVVTGPATTTARIRVTWGANAAVADTSNVTFRIP